MTRKRKIQLIVALIISLAVCLPLGILIYHFLQYIEPMLTPVNERKVLSFGHVGDSILLTVALLPGVYLFVATLLIRFMAFLKKYL
ncbi:MAG: hypothetical protein LBE91_21375 [Tannerella sp.]|jgi:4-amino-4-deoxy-L-arabinose transferase-like glycosyltransferase|nr:hypothetical protein [Tannerella sp.]